MILLDENLKIVHDEVNEPGEKIRQSLIQCNAMCAYLGENILYRFNDRGDLFLVFLSKPKFHSVHLGRWDREVFRRERRLASDTMVVRDIGCEQSRIYLDDYSFVVPTELLLR